MGAAFRAERDKRKQIERKAQDRLIRIVGRALLAAAEQSSEFDVMLKGVIRNTRVPESERKFLRSKNWM